MTREHTFFRTIGCSVARDAESGLSYSQGKNAPAHFPPFTYLSYKIFPRCTPYASTVTPVYPCKNLNTHIAIPIPAPHVGCYISAIRHTLSGSLYLLLRAAFNHYTRRNTFCCYSPSNYSQRPLERMCNGIYILQPVKHLNLPDL